MKQIRLISFNFIFAIALCLFAGCGDITLRNLTTSKIPQNPSRIYTLSVDAEVKNGSVDRKSMQTEIVINGETFPMVKSDAGKDIWEFDYRLPGDRRGAKYFYQVKYDVTKVSGKEQRVAKGSLQQFELSNRYIISLESERGPVGATIPVLGRGFTEFDKIHIGDLEASTTYVSDSQLKFVVPTLPSGNTYSVYLDGANGKEPFGKFRVDPSTINVHPKMLRLQAGQSELMIFQIEFEAPPNGLYVDVKTDIPQSLKMPEVIIPGGSRTVSVNVQGAQPGTGSLVIRMPGYDEVTIPVEVL